MNLKLKLVIFVVLCSHWNLIEACQGPITRVLDDVFVFLTNDLTESLHMSLKNFPSMAHHEMFKRNRPTVIYIHGALYYDPNYFSTVDIRGAYRHEGKHNFISVYWEQYSDCRPHNEGIRMLKYVAEAVAQQLKKFVEEGGYGISNFHLVGHSIGAHAAGLIGRHLKEISRNQLVIPRIYALNPGRYGFETSKPWGGGFEGISKNDATYVQVIHTSAGTDGISGSVGHVDFYPNGGKVQNGCDKNFDPNPDNCNTRRAWYYYQESVRNAKAFTASKCASFDQFKANKCSKETANMGFGADLAARGDFYLRTHRNFFESSFGEEGKNFQANESLR